MAYTGFNKPEDTPLMTLIRNTALLTSAIGLLAAPAGADPVEEFYKGKQMTIVVGNAEGGTYDYYGRLGAMIMEKFLPGNPKVVMQYMPGAGGTKAANYMAQIAPKDGSVLSSMHASAV
jgi:tripartite-type tricarboxylate transporter receptor subunit TctC